jgi:2'-5' RNA ligase
MPRLRLGAALLVPPPIAGEVDGLRRACGDGSLGRIPPHLTLVPPVNVRVDDLPAALARVREAAASVGGPIGLELGPVATFHPETPVLYLAVGGEPGALDALRRARDAVFRPPLARTLTWPFVPHVTLADEVDPDRIPAAEAALGGYRTDVTFGYLTLLQERQPGRVWMRVADARLGPPAVIARGGLSVELWWSSMTDPEVGGLLAPEFTVPEGGRPFVLTARREAVVLGAARGWMRDGTAEVVEVVVTEAAGLEDIERHLTAAIDAAEAADAIEVADAFDATDAANPP